MSETLMKQLQLALEGLGFDPGPIDGVFGPGTKAAAAAFALSEKGYLEQDVPVTPPAIKDKVRVALIVGHNSRSKGAVRVTDNVSEFDYNTALAAEVKEYIRRAGHMCEVFYRNSGVGYTTEIKQAYAASDGWGADVSVELHFNASAQASATGTETLSSGSAFSMRVAKETNKRMVAALGLRDRGVLVRKRGDRGGESLHQGRAPAVLIEPYFGSNAGDCQTADRNREALVAAIAEGALSV